MGLVPARYGCLDGRGPLLEHGCWDAECAGMSGVALTSVTLEYGGVGFRSTLVTAANIVMCLPLSESSDIATVAHDIRGLNDGTYVGSGFTRRVTLPIPEGGLGTTFAGAEYVEVLDDGEGVDDPPYQNLGLSLQGGSMDVIFLIKTFTDDATLRCIVQKQETDSSGDGWHVALQNGGIVFTLIVASSTIFSFTRGAIADGDWHLVNCVYKPGGGDDVARIYIDGVASGADVTSVSTEPAFTTANLRVGTFNDGAGDLIGSLAFVTLGRTGDTALPATLDTALDWTDFTVDTNAAAAPLVFELGRGSGRPYGSRRADGADDVRAQERPEQQRRGGGVLHARAQQRAPWLEEGRPHSADARLWRHLLLQVARLPVECHPAGGAVSLAGRVLHVYGLDGCRGEHPHLSVADTSGLDPISWTRSERWIRCPEWQQPHVGGHAGNSVTSSGLGRSGWCWKRGRRSAPSPASWILPNRPCGNGSSGRAPTAAGAVPV